MSSPPQDISFLNHQVLPSPIEQDSDPTTRMTLIRPSLSRVSSSHSDVLISSTGLLHVLGYTPAEGEAGAPISVRIHFHPEISDAIYVRIVVGHKAVGTTVREIKDAAYGRWQLDALAPPFESLQSPSTKVLVSVQALNDEHAILDAVTFGEFTYWAPGQPHRPIPISTIFLIFI